MPAYALGGDLDWVRHHTGVRAEAQKFVMPYHMIPTFRESAGYLEFAQVLSPRWYVAARGGFSNSNSSGKARNLETAAGYRPNRHQLVKISYEFERYSSGAYPHENTLAVQLVTNFHVAAGRD